MKVNDTRAEEDDPMFHVMVDGTKGFRSRFDHIELIQEVLEELPTRLGIEPAAPAFLLPYHNGVVQEDCGVSAFVFLRGGHFTLHTFSFREAYFADIVSPAAFNVTDLRAQLDAAFPCENCDTQTLTRVPGAVHSVPPDVEQDFGPHVFLDIEDYTGPCAMDTLFDLFDVLPWEIGMTPIMRPYLIKGTTTDARRVISAVTMIAESHIILHVFPDEGRAFLDLFSCRFFETEPVLRKIKAALPGRVANEAMMARGRQYRLLCTQRDEEVARHKGWLDAIQQVPR